MRFLFVLLANLSTLFAYNAPGCPSWPTLDEWEEEIATKLSDDAALHGPYPEASSLRYFKDECEKLGTNAYAISKAGDGICMQAFACSHEFCRPNRYSEDLPYFILEAKTPSDIQEGLKFAKEHNIQVTVKTTGHSYHGASTAKNSLLIWMQNYPKDGTITDNYETCDGTVHHAAISINGGETWDDVIEAVGPNYHVVTGGGRTVSAAGGWLQGSGLSFSSRQYGLGVDQALQFQVVLADGSIVTANACENEDLFWALRGGGGGTWGVVTNVMYKLHPLVPITQTYWFIEGWENSPSIETSSRVLEKWLKFWIAESPTLDRRFGGYWNGAGVHLVFAGTREEANAAFLDKFDEWYSSDLIPVAEFSWNWGAYPPTGVTSEVPSWYEYKGGKAAYNNPDMTDPTGFAYAGVENLSTRLVPVETLQNDPDGIYELVYDLAWNVDLGSVNYILGGVVGDISDDATSVSPALRKAGWNLFTSNSKATEKVNKVLPNSITGACFNHHSPVEPEWKESLWGNQYSKLLDLKEIYDPHKVFQCWHCVGYEGEEPGVPYKPTCPDGSPVPNSGKESMVPLFSHFHVVSFIVFTLLYIVVM